MFIKALLHVLCVLLVSAPMSGGDTSHLMCDISPEQYLRLRTLYFAVSDSEDELGFNTERQAKMRELRETGPHAAKVIEYEMKSQSEQPRRLVIGLHLLAELAHSGEALRRAAQDLLARTNRGQISFSHVAQLALQALAVCGQPEDSELVWPFLEHEDIGCRCRAARCLLAIGDARSIPLLEEAQQKANQDSRFEGWNELTCPTIFYRALTWIRHREALAALETATEPPRVAELTRQARLLQHKKHVWELQNRVRRTPAGPAKDALMAKLEALTQSNPLASKGALMPLSAFTPPLTMFDQYFRDKEDEQ